MDELFERGLRFLKNIKPSEKVGLICHNDVDGICSGTLVKMGLERMGIKLSKIVPGTYRKLVDTLQDMDVDKIIIVDIGSSHKFAQYFTRPTLYIDHHMIKGDINNDKIVFINPRFDDPETYQSASCVVYKFLSKLIDLEDSEWIAVLGAVGDFVFEDCRNLMEKYGIKTKDGMEDTKFGKASFILTGALHELEFEKVMEILSTASDLERLTENKEIKEASEKYNKLYDKEMDNFWKNSESVDNVIFSKIKPEYRGMGSSIVNEVSRKNPDKIIFLFEDVGDKYDIDARQQGDVNLGKILEKTCGGGGHKNAAGGMIEKTKLENFKKVLLKEINES
jgi:single-stranded DNA-specific DHH superfamily exonuclease